MNPTLGHAEEIRQESCPEKEARSQEEVCTERPEPIRVFHYEARDWSKLT
jgi:hypothetical protein